MNASPYYKIKKMKVVYQGLWKLKKAPKLQLAFSYANTDRSQTIIFQNVSPNSNILVVMFTNAIQCSANRDAVVVVVVVVVEA